jgi:hypothetical protein
MLVAFNNMGFDHLPEAAPYVQAGVAGLAQAAHDLGFRAFQLDVRRPRDPRWFSGIDVAALRRRLEQLDVRLHLHDHAIEPVSLYHFAERDDYYAAFGAYARLTTLSAAGRGSRPCAGAPKGLLPPDPAAAGAGR